MPGRLRRDEQDETACCLIQECSRVLRPLPHQNVPFAILNHFSRCGDRLLARHFALFAEHHRRRFLLSPNLHPTLHRAQEPVRVLPGMCRLKPLKQLAARVPRLGLEPSVQLLCDLHQRIGPPPAALRLRHRYGRGPCLAFPPRDAQSGKELLQRRYSRVRRRGDRLVDNVHNALCRTRICLSSRIGSSRTDSSATRSRTCCGVPGSASSLWQGVAGGW